VVVGSRGGGACGIEVLAVVIDVCGWVWGVLDDGRWGGKKHEVIESYSKHVTCTSTHTGHPPFSVSLLLSKDAGGIVSLLRKKETHNWTTATGKRRRKAARQFREYQSS
jgi:hypothetical protein